MHGRTAEADVVVNGEPPIPYVLMHRPGHPGQEMTIVLGPYDVFLAVSEDAEHAAYGLGIRHHSRAHLLDRIVSQVLELVIPGNLAITIIRFAISDIRLERTGAQRIDLLDVRGVQSGT